MPNIRFHFLDYLRIFAATTVFFGHNVSTFLQDHIASIDFHDSSIFLWNMFYFVRFVTEMGGAGVVVFFLVSGYIITHSLKFSSANSFVVRRIFRIYPAFILALLLQAFFTGHVLNYRDLLWQTTLLGDIVGLPYGLGGVEWTLRIELYFYIFMYLLKRCDIINNRLLPLIFLAPTIILFIGDPLPSSGFFAGYISLYTPLLFIGSCVYIAQFIRDSRVPSMCVATVIYGMHVQQLVNYNKGYVYIRFLHVGLLVWFICWYFQKLFVSHIIITGLSNITYSFYLYHNWIVPYIIEYISSRLFPQSILFPYLLLLLLSALIYVVIEKFFILLGNKLLFAIRNNSRYRLL